MSPRRCASGLLRQLPCERQAGDGADGARHPRDLDRGHALAAPASARARRSPRQGRPRGRARRRSRSEPAASAVAAAISTAPAKETAGAEQQPAREPLAEQQAREQGDQDRTDADEHHGGARVDPVLRGVERDVVDGEPRDAAEHDQHPLASRGADPRPAGEHRARRGRCCRRGDGRARAGRARTSRARRGSRRRPMPRPPP